MWSGVSCAVRNSKILRGDVSMKVVIKNEEGKYLSSSQGKIIFVERITRAFVYDYEEDKVEEQLKIAKLQFGYAWNWENVGDADGLLCLHRIPYESEISDKKMQ